MQEAYKKKLLARIHAAWPQSGYTPVDAVKRDGRTWLVTYQQETGECITAPLLKRELRVQERKQAFEVLSHVAFPSTLRTPPSLDLSEKEAARIHQVVCSSVGAYSQSPVRILAAFVDTLVLNVYPTDLDFALTKRRIDGELQEELDQLKQLAQDNEEPVPTRFIFPAGSDAHLFMKAKGGEGFNWILSNSQLSLAVNRGAKMAMLSQVRCSSEYLWSLRDLGRVVSNVHVFLTSIFGQYIKLQVSAVDLAADVIGLELGMERDVQEHFVTRAQMDAQMPLDAQEDGLVDGPDGIRRRWRMITGLPFGARAGKVSALIYDKKHEIKYKSPKKEWFHDLWRSVLDEDGNPLWDGEAPVWRIEVRFKRAALHEMKQDDVFWGIEDAFELEVRLAGLWSYAVGHVGGGPDGLPDGWLRYVVPTADTNRSRWPVHPDWHVIQGAFQPREEALPESDYEREEREKEELLCLVDEQLAGESFYTSYVETSYVERPGRRRRKSSSRSPEPLMVPDDVILDLRPFIRKRKRQKNMRQLVAQIAGCVETLEAWRPEGRLEEDVQPDLSDTLHFVYQAVEDYWLEKDRDYARRVHKKRVLYELETTSAAGVA
jgi:hypothetical protein